MKSTMKKMMTVVLLLLVMAALPVVSWAEDQKPAAPEQMAPTRKATEVRQPMSKLVYPGTFSLPRTATTIPWTLTTKAKMAKTRTTTSRRR